MKNTILAAALALLLAACHDHDHDDDPMPGGYLVYGNGHPIQASTSDGWILSNELELRDLINNHRVAIGIPALIDSGPLRDLARAHSIHQAVHGFTGSVNPEGDAPGDRADIAGIPWTAFGENVVWDRSTASGAFSDMRASPGMHDNIDDPAFVFFGTGYEHDSSSSWNDYWTVDFREP
jgi:uncharacterized protein YkwD